MPPAWPRKRAPARSGAGPRSRGLAGATEPRPRLTLAAGGARGGEDSLSAFSARADRLVARLRRLQRVPLPAPASGAAARPRPRAELARRRQLGPVKRPSRLDPAHRAGQKDLARMQLGRRRHSSPVSIPSAPATSIPPAGDDGEDPPVRGRRQPPPSTAKTLARDASSTAPSVEQQRQLAWRAPRGARVAVGPLVLAEAAGRLAAAQGGATVPLGKTSPHRPPRPRLAGLPRDHEPQFPSSISPARRRAGPCLARRGAPNSAARLAPSRVMWASSSTGPPAISSVSNTPWLGSGAVPVRPWSG